MVETQQVTDARGPFMDFLGCTLDGLNDRLMYLLLTEPNSEEYRQEFQVVLAAWSAVAVALRNTYAASGSDKPFFSKWVTILPPVRGEL